MRGAPVAGLILTALAVLVVGCVPARRPPPALAAIAPPVSWRDAPAGDGAIDPHWWRAYGDDDLDALVDAALARNTDVLTAIAVVEHSRAATRIARADALPNISALGNAQVAGQSGGAMDTPIEVTETLEGGALLTWQIDLFGRVRALTEAARPKAVVIGAFRDVEECADRHDPARRATDRPTRADRNCAAVDRRSAGPLPRGLYGFPQRAGCAAHAVYCATGGDHRLVGSIVEHRGTRRRAGRGLAKRCAGADRRQHRVSAPLNAGRAGRSDATNTPDQDRIVPNAVAHLASSASIVCALFSTWSPGLKRPSSLTCWV